jgi:hypothetical protein
MVHGEVQSSSRSLVACAQDTKTVQRRLEVLRQELNGSWRGPEMVPVNDATSGLGGQLRQLERELRALAEDMDREAAAVRAEIAAEAERLRIEREKAEREAMANKQDERGAK